MEFISKVNSLTGFSSKLISLLCEKVKEKKDEKSIQELGFLYTAVSISLSEEYRSYFINFDEKTLNTEIEDILIEIDNKKIKDIFSQGFIDIFIEKIRMKNIIYIEYDGKEASEYEKEKFYLKFKENLKLALNKLSLKSSTLSNALITLAAINSMDNNENINKSIDKIKLLLEEIIKELKMNIKKEDEEGKKVAIISFGKHDDEELKKMYYSTCNLLGYFNGRYIKADKSWEEIKDEIVRYANTLIPGSKYTIYFFAHLSIAYCLGACINSKDSRKVSIMQQTSNNTLDWRISENDNDELYKDNLFEKYNKYLIDEEKRDIVISIGITQKIFEDVREFCIENNLEVKQIINIDMGDKCGNSSVKSGKHAWMLAEKVKEIINKERIRGNVHLFMAVPNAFAFFLGQLTFNLKNVTLYEYAEDDLYIESMHIKDVEALSLT